MNINFWSPIREYHKYKSEINTAIHRVLSKGQLCLGFGPDIEEFEEKFAKFIGTEYAVMTGSGTQALFLAYKSLEIGPEDEVITTSHTFIATIDQIVACGAKPILVDIDPKTGLIDPKEISKAITSRTKAIVPVHLEGKVCDMDRIIKITSDEFKISIVEDSAQAVGASWLGLKTGSIGHIGCFSFYPAKILGSYGNAGAITTNNKELADRIKMLRCNSNVGKNPDLNAEYGFNLEPDNIQAAVLNVKMRHLEARIAKRDEIAEYYNKELANTPLVLPLKQPGRVFQDYVIRTKTTEERDELNKFLNEQGVGTLGANLIPNHHYKKLNLNFTLPNTDKYIATQIRIPCNPDLIFGEQEYIIETIKKFYDQ